MGVLKYAILGLLNQKERSGYDLTKEFESTLNEFWNAKQSQIYPELKKLTEDGCVEYRVEISGTALEKKIYSITPKGREDFMAWLRERRPLPATPKSEPRLQIFFSSALSAQERMSLLTDQLEKHRRRMAHLQNNMEKFPQVPPAESDAFGDYLVLLGAIMREENNCRWLEQCINLCGK